MVKEVLENGNAVFVCPQCGKEFTGAFYPALKELCEKACCNECVEKHTSEERAREREMRKKHFIDTVDQRMSAAGFEGVFCSIEAPVTRHNAEFIWKHRDENLFISGETGAGKTSSAAFVIRHMMKEKYLKVMYRNWSSLHSEYVSVKVNDDKSAERRFFDKINSLDYLVIDELAWRRGNSKLSPAAQELLFDIIDKAYNKERKTKIWIMGNFYGHVLEKMLDDPKPVARRLQFAFETAWFDFSASPSEMVIYSEAKEKK